MSLALSEHLPLIAAAPDGIQKLRGLILELAVRGKLVPQDPKDEPANKLIDRIDAERIQREARSKGKKSKPIHPISKSRCSLAVPQGWQLTSLGSLLLEIRSGGTPSKSNPQFWNGNIPWASVKDLGFGEPLTETQDKITAAGLAAGSFLASAGSILVCTRMGLGKIGEAKIDVAINQDLKALLLGSEFNKQYFINFFITLSIKGSGMTVAGIKQDELLGFVVPVPPIAEQHRIVAKVDELMALCDRLESEQNDSAAAHTQLVETLLGTLTQSTDAADFESNWQRIAEYFDTLFTTEASIEGLQKSILQLAVMGKLVPQDSRSAPESSPLKKFSQGQPNPLLPSGWVYSTMGEAVEIIRGITFPSNEKSKSPMPGRVICLRTSNVQNKIEWGDVLYIRNEFVSRDNQYLIENDVVMSMANSRELVGKVALIESLPNERATFGGFLGVLRPISVLPKFLMAFLRSPAVRSALIRSASQTTNIANISLTKLRPLMLPIPPITEQHQIVAKIDELMAVCDQLKASIKAATAAQSTLSSALIQQALEAA